MAFFNEIGKRISGVAQSTQKAAEIARLQRLATAKKNETTSLMAQIGKQYYEAYRAGEDAEDALKALCGRIDALHTEIDHLGIKLDELRQIRRCAHCGSVQNNDNRYCSSCGEKLVERTAPAEEVVMQAGPAQPETPAHEEDTDALNTTLEFDQLIGNSDLSFPDELNKDVFIRWPAPEEESDEGDSEEESEEA